MGNAILTYWQGLVTEKGTARNTDAQNVANFLNWQGGVEIRNEKERQSGFLFHRIARRLSMVRFRSSMAPHYTQRTASGRIRKI